MRFTSPWLSSFYLKAVDLVRFLLRPVPRLENSFIRALTRRQNKRVVRYLEDSRPETILLIMPRCVKKAGCRADVQNSLGRCLTCRDCPLGDVARLCDRYGIPALVAFRSHIAFAIARTRRPDLIIATACGDRLVKALRSVPEIPALLAPLQDMEKMCVNAVVDLVWLEQQLRLATGLREAPETEPRTSAARAQEAAGGNVL